MSYEFRLLLGCYLVSMLQIWQIMLCLCTHLLVEVWQQHLSFKSLPTSSTLLHITSSIMFLLGCYLVLHLIEFISLLACRDICLEVCNYIRLPAVPSRQSYLLIMEEQYNHHRRWRWPWLLFIRCTHVECRFIFLLTIYI